MLKKTKPKAIGLIYINDKDRYASMRLIGDLCSAGDSIFQRIIIVDLKEEMLDKAMSAKLKQSSIDHSFYYFGHSKDIRGIIFKEILSQAYEEGFDYLAQFNEGAPECAEAAMPLFQKSGNISDDALVFYRNPDRLNPGRLFNFLACKMTGFPDVKGDGINVYNIKSFVEKKTDVMFGLSDDSFYFWDILQYAKAKNLKVGFSQPVRLSSPGSPVVLNTMFFMKFIYKAFRKAFFGKREIFKSKTRINPREILRSSQNVQIAKAIPSSEPSKKLDEALKAVEKDKKTEGLVRLDHYEKAHSETLVVNWCLTNICNYKCSYCPEDLHNGTRRGPKLEDIQNFFQKIKSAHPGKKIFFEFTGGEVTYYKQFPELIRYIKAEGGYVGILSNAGRKLDFWEKHHEFIDHICLSFHSEQGDPEHFYNVASYLCQRVSTHINIMMKPENFEVCYNLSRRLAADCELTIAMQPLLENMDGALYDYTPEQKKILDEQKLPFGSEPKFKQREDYKDFIFRGAMKGSYADGSSQIFSTPELISKNLNQWAGWNCHIGLENLAVGLEGQVIRGWCGVGGIIGNVSDPDLKLPKKPVLCNKKHCNCGQDIMATKVKPSRVSAPK